MPSIDENAAAIVTSLRRIQTEGDPLSNFCIFFGDRNKNYYIQFAAVAGEAAPEGAALLYAEAAGNEVLAPEHALKPDQIVRLRQLGWNPSSSGPNFSRTCKASSDYERVVIAREVMRAFEQAYGIPSDQTLIVELHIVEEANFEAGGDA